jgi:hypothetical protein
MMLNAKATKTGSCDFDATIWVLCTETVEAQRQEGAVVFNQARIAGDLKD